jgi:hypothetical protein
MTTITPNTENQINSLIQDMPNPDNITNDLNTLKSKYAPILDDFKKYYVLHQQYPDLNEYNQMFSSIKGNLQGLNSDLFTLKNNIQNSSHQQNMVMQQVNKEIKKEKLLHTKLLKKLNLVNNEINGTKEMAENYTSMYNFQFFSNMTMFLGIVILGTVIYKVYKKRYLPN